MKKTPYIFKQNSRYYYRRRLSKKSIFTCSLHTDSLIVAKHIADIINYKIKNLFVGYDAVTYVEELEYINKIVAVYAQEALTEYSMLEHKRHEACKTNNMDGAHPDAIKREHDKINSALYTNNVDDVFFDVFKRSGIKKSSFEKLSDNAQRNFKYILLKQELDILKQDCDRSIEYLKPIATLEQNQNTTPTLPAHNQHQQYYAKKAIELMDNFLTEKRREKITDIKEYENTLNMFVKFCDKDYLYDINQSMINDFVALVHELPISSGKAARDIYSICNGDMRAVVKLAKEARLTCISSATYNKKIIYVSCFLDWAEHNEYLDRNRCTKKLINTKKKPDEHMTFTRKKVTYTDEMLNKLLHSSWYMDINKNIKTQPWKIYVPLILMYHSFRLEEVASLSISQILEPNYPEAQNYWCFKIVEAKNASSLRTIPIHPKLIDLKFIEFYKHQCAQHVSNIWGLNDTVNGFLRPISRAFNKKTFKAEFIPTELLEDKKLRFDTHSFRHLVGTKLKSTTTEFVLNAIFGHSGATQTSWYGEPIDIKTKYEVLEQLSYNIGFDMIENYFENTPKGEWF